MGPSLKRMLILMSIFFIFFGVLFGALLPFLLIIPVIGVILLAVTFFVPKKWNIRRCQKCGYEFTPGAQYIKSSL